MATGGAETASGPGRFYEILEIPTSATTEEIRRAFRRLARIYHPDRNPGDAAAEERFKELRRAHDVLVDVRLRALYDEFGEAGLRRGFDAVRARTRRVDESFRGADPAKPAAAGPARRRGPLEGFFSGLFVRARPPERGADLELTVPIEFLEALRGTERLLSVHRPERCAACSGSGTDAAGRACPACRGSGATDTRVRLKARIPKGVATGSRIRLEGQGGAGRNGGPPGDLWLTIQVTEHPRFGRIGDDVTIDVPVTVAEAVRGARLTIPTPEGDVNLRIPAGTQSGARLRLRGKGAPRLGGGPRGDLIARVLIHVPESGDGLAAIAESLEPLYSPAFRRRFSE